ncbi:hypothetical protein JVT61DRAFT_2053 [Boletus reticuloceps]|uniref:CHCH domain-containing protein n=1 Tax=Boletus reticuloceps TaxID=495285 RepID=A0A8I2YRH0_9AGAM|nr:hypothetical protein JVT61DRAFT_2053 [Boletus reticuloceps]
MVHIAHVKVRPTKLQRRSPCKAEFVAMLGCWAATGDVLSADPARCKEVADALFNCMRTTVGRPPSCVFPAHSDTSCHSLSTPNHNDRPSTIHLSKLQRKVK